MPMRNNKKTCTYGWKDYELIWLLSGESDILMDDIA